MSPSDLQRRRANIAIAVIIVIGVALRLLVTRAQGFPSDVGTFIAWAEKLAAVGPGGFYEPGYFSDYPPAFLYVLWAIGALFNGDALRFAVKAISIPADIGIVLLIVPLIRRHAGSGAAILAAGIWMLQPAPIFAGPYWGQVDADGTAITLAIPDLAPVMTLKVKYKLLAADGAEMADDVYLTVNKVP